MLSFPYHRHSFQSHAFSGNLLRTMRRFLHKKNAGMTGNVNLTKCLNENNKKCHSEAFFAEA